MANMQASLILSLIDKVTAPARGVEKAMAGIQGQMERNSVAIRETQGKLFGAVAAATGFAAALAYPISAAANFEASMNRVEAALGVAGPELEELSDKAKQLGATTQFSASQAADAIEMLAKNSVSSADILGGALDASLLLAAASGSDLATAADLATDVMANFNKTAEEMGAVVDGVSGTLMKSKFGIDDYRLALAQAGGVAGPLGVEFEDFNAAIAATSSSFASGSDAGTSFKTFLGTLVPSSKPAAEAMKRLGLEFFDAEGNMKSMSEVAQELQDGVAGLSEEARNDALKTIFGQDAIRTALALAREGSAGIEELLVGISEVSAQDQADARMKGWNGMMKQLQSITEALAIAIGDTLLPSMTAFAEQVIPIIGAIAEWVSGNEELVRRIIMVSGALLGLRIAMLGLKLLGLTGKQGILMAIAAGLNTVGRAASRMKAATSEAIALQKSLAALNAVPVGLTPLQRANRDVEKAPLSKMDKIKATLRAIAGVSGLSVVASGISLLVGAITAPGLFAAGLALGAVALGAWALSKAVENWDAISSAFKGVASAIRDDLGPLIESTLSPFLPIIENDIERIKIIANGIKIAVDLAMKAVTSIADTVKSVFEGDFFEKNVLGEEEKASIEARAKEMTQNIIDAILFMPRAIAKVGTDIVQSIWDGMDEKLEELLEWVTGIPGRIASAFSGSTDPSGSESPSPANTDAPPATGPQAPPRARALGGHISANMPYTVGEQGPEGIFPSHSGYVATTRQMQALAQMASRVVPRAISVPSPVAIGGGSSQHRERGGPQTVNVSFGDINVPGTGGASLEEMSKAFGDQIAGRLRSGYGDFA